MVENRSLTTGEVAGSGLFDELMRTVKGHLQEELQEQRITGSDYSQVYLGSLTACLQTGAQYTLQRDMTNKQLELLEEQRKQLVAHTALAVEQKNQLIANTALVVNQDKQVIAQTLVIDEQLASEKLQTAISQYNLDNLLPEQLKQLRSATENTVAGTGLIDKQSLQAEAQISLTGKNESLVDEQITIAGFQYTDAEGGMLKDQQDRVKGEINLLATKRTTEQAQTLGDKDSTAGLVGAELLLKSEQAKSFAVNAATQTVKLFSDTHSVIYSTNPEGVPDYGLNATNSNIVTTHLIGLVTGE